MDVTARCEAPIALSWESQSPYLCRRGRGKDVCDLRNYTFCLSSSLSVAEGLLQALDLKHRVKSTYSLVLRPEPQLRGDGRICGAGSGIPLLQNFKFGSSCSINALSSGPAISCVTVIFFFRKTLPQAVSMSKCDDDAPLLAPQYSDPPLQRGVRVTLTRCYVL